MGANIVLSELKSQVVRQEVSENNEGIRTIKGADVESRRSGFLETIGGFFNATINFGGWILGKLTSALNFGFASAWGWCVNTVQFIWHFDWNQTDASLDSLLANVGQTLGALAGGTLGNLVGYLVCGVVPAAAMATFNEALALSLLKDVGEEALEELAGNLAALCQQAAYLGFQALFINIFKATRRTIKNFFKDPNSKQSELARRAFGGGFDHAVKSWGNGKNSWTLAQKFEDKIESIESPFLRSFTEEFFEEAFDACAEAGYIIAGGIDNYVAQQKLARENLLGQERVIQVTPNREIPDERIILSGPDTLIRPVLVQTLNNYNLVENRDVGQIMGSQLRTLQRKDPLELGLRIVWKSKPRPPWGADCEECECNIEGIKTSIARDWDRIKFLAGGQNGFMWGRFRCQVNLSNGGQLVINGNTADEAKQMANMLLNLTEFDLVTMRITELEKIGRAAQNQPLFLEERRMYPAFMTIINRKKIINEWNNEQREGQATLTGTYKQRKYQLPLWTANPPRNYDSIITELLHDGTGTA